MGAGIQLRPALWLLWLDRDPWFSSGQRLQGVAGQFRKRQALGAPVQLKSSVMRLAAGHPLIEKLVLVSPRSPSLLSE